MQSEKAHQKVSEWLADLGTHEIYEYAGISDDFIKCTGIEVVPFGSATAESYRKAVRARGLGGVEPQGDAPMVDALAIAYACYQKYAGDEKAVDKLGRGSQFWEYQAAIVRNGN